MTYKVRANRDGEGCYTLSYGKGGKKITRRCMKAGRGWKVIDAPKALLGTFGTLDQVKQGFEAWAGKEYGGPIEDNPLIDSPVSDEGTILDERLNKYGAPPPSTKSITTNPPREEGNDAIIDLTEFGEDPNCPDPFDPDNYTHDDNGRTILTEVGALRYVFQWGHGRFGTNLPRAVDMVRRVLERRFPQDAAYRK
jgi:hypothetical protein